MSDFSQIIDFIKSLYPDEIPVPLHAPRFTGNEKKYLGECIDSTYVSYVGQFVKRFEEMISGYTGAKYSLAIVNGTCALHVLMHSIGVRADTEVITQSLTFVATVNAIKYCGAYPVFVDVDRSTLGMSPASLKNFLNRNVEKTGGRCINKLSGRKIAACMPMHTFGHPCRIDEIAEVCKEYGIPLIEDSAESLGSRYKNKHTGTFGLAGVYSFNGNKTVTCGGGGIVVTDNEEVANKVRHLSTTAKLPHPFEFIHDEVGYNYRLPNVNAAIACAQMEQIDSFIENKRNTASEYKNFLSSSGITFIEEPRDSYSNYWLNAVILNNKLQRDEFLKQSNAKGVMTRPIWTLMSKLDMYKDCINDGLANSIWLEERVVNIPSSVRINK